MDIKQVRKIANAFGYQIRARKTNYGVYLALWRDAWCISSCEEHESTKLVKIILEAELKKM